MSESKAELSKKLPSKRVQKLLSKNVWPWIFGVILSIMMTVAFGFSPFGWVIAAGVGLGSGLVVACTMRLIEEFKTREVKLAATAVMILIFAITASSVLLMPGINLPMLLIYASKFLGITFLSMGGMGYFKFTSLAKRWSALILTGVLVAGGFAVGIFFPAISLFLNITTGTSFVTALTIGGVTLSSVFIPILIGFVVLLSFSFLYMRDQKQQKLLKVAALVDSTKVSNKKGTENTVSTALVSEMVKYTFLEAAKNCTDSKIEFMVPSPSTKDAIRAKEAYLFYAKKIKFYEVIMQVKNAVVPNSKIVGDLNLQQEFIIKGMQKLNQAVFDNVSSRITSSADGKTPKEAFVEIILGAGFLGEELGTGTGTGSSSAVNLGITNEEISALSRIIFPGDLEPCTLALKETVQAPVEEKVYAPSSEEKEPQSEIPNNSLLPNNTVVNSVQSNSSLPPYDTPSVESNSNQPTREEALKSYLEQAKLTGFNRALHMEYCSPQLLLKAGVNKMNLSTLQRMETISVHHFVDMYGGEIPFETMPDSNGQTYGEAFLTEIIKAGLFEGLSSDGQEEVRASMTTGEQSSLQTALTAIIFSQALRTEKWRHLQWIVNNSSENISEVRDFFLKWEIQGQDFSEKLKYFFEAFESFEDLKKLEKYTIQLIEACSQKGVDVMEDQDAPDIAIIAKQAYLVCAKKFKFDKMIFLNIVGYEAEVPAEIHQKMSNLNQAMFNNVATINTKLNPLKDSLIVGGNEVLNPIALSDKIYGETFVRAIVNADFLQSVFAEHERLERIDLIELIKSKLQDRDSIDREMSKLFFPDEYRKKVFESLEAWLNNLDSNVLEVPDLLRNFSGGWKCFFESCDTKEDLKKVEDLAIRFTKECTNKGIDIMENKDAPDIAIVAQQALTACLDYGLQKRRASMLERFEGQMGLWKKVLGNEKSKRDDVTRAMKELIMPEDQALPYIQAMQPLQHALSSNQRETQKDLRNTGGVENWTDSLFHPSTGKTCQGATARTAARQSLNRD